MSGVPVKGGGRVRLTVRPETLAGPSDVAARIEKSGGKGWICTTGRAFRYEGGAVGDETVLSAEIAVSETESLHVRRQGDGWTAWSLVEGDDGEHECVVFDDELLSTEGDAELLYRTFWKAEERDGVPVRKPFAARFKGWKP
ncbi:MAG: hypothetical protein QME96_10345 [Myxococcota bacterium]|nr:hypothetical protein [Myxococcota bacterium]